MKLMLPHRIHAGGLLKICDGGLCRSYRVTRISDVDRGRALHLIEVAGSFMKDPMVVFYNDCKKLGDHHKEAERKTCAKFGVHRATLLRHRARR